MTGNIDSKIIGGVKSHFKDSFVRSDKIKLIYISSVALIFGFRVAPLFNPSSLWAEDANALFGPAISDLNQEASTGLLSTYKNQVFLFNRLLVQVILFFVGNQYAVLPFVSTLVSVIFVPILASIWLRKNALFRNEKYNYLVFGYILLSPVSHEPLGNLANIATYLLFCCVALVGIAKPKSKIGLIFELFLVLLATFTGGLGIILFVVLLLRKFLTGYFPKIQISLVVFSLIFQSRGWLDRGSNNFNLIQDISLTVNILLKRIGAETLTGQTGGAKWDEHFSANIWNGIGLIILLLIFLPIFFIFVKCGVNSSRAIFVPPIILLCYFGMFIYSNNPTGLNDLMTFGAQGRHLIVLHLLLFVLALVVFEYSTKILDRKIIVPTLLFLVIVGGGTLSDFVLQDKTPSVFASYWEDFAKCVEKRKTYCYTRVPPDTLGWGLAWKP